MKFFILINLLIISFNSFSQDTYSYLDVLYKGDIIRISYDDKSVIKLIDISLNEVILQLDYRFYEDDIFWKSILLTDGSVHSYILNGDLLLVSLKEVNNASNIVAINLKERKVIRNSWFPRNEYERKMLFTALPFALYDIEDNILITGNRKYSEVPLKIHFFKISPDSIKFLKSKDLQNDVDVLSEEEKLAKILINELNQ